ncbi:MAG: universal stress protein [Anaerolineales bacterium]|jgi:nucleotide-binding universal stress UspA family protein
MPGIVCGIRGGPNSQPTIDKAISLSKEKDQQIYFLYVVNLDFLVHTESGRTQAFYEQLDQMGEFILLTAQEKAKANNVSAEGIIRHGQVREEIIGLANEIQAEYVVLGLPQGTEESNVFAEGMISEYGKRLEEETGAKVIFAERLDE